MRYIIYNILILFLFLNFQIVHALNYPKLANYYLKTPISNNEAYELAKWDVVILGMQVQDTNPEIFNILRKKNLDIKIIAYLSSMEFPVSRYQALESINGPWHKMYNQLKNSWWLKDGKGGDHSIWPGNKSLNVADYCPTVNGEKFNTFLPKFVQQEIMSTGLWDGVYFDSVLDGIKFTNNGNIDIDNNNIIDEKNWADNKWREGAKILLNNTRKLIGEDKIILVNSSSYGYQYFNGRLYETWPSPWYGGWQGEMNDYKNLQRNSNYQPAVVILNPNTNNTGNNTKYRQVRFGLASTLMEDGYFAYDFGTNDHSQLWWYDEYDVNLGQPTGESKNLFGPSEKYISSVWQRDFSNGIALVNSTKEIKNINLDDNDGVYEKIRGVQDSTVNDGSLVKKIILGPEDGIILLRKLKSNELTGVVFENGDFVRVFDKKGNPKRAGFYAYDSQFPGGVQIINIDIDQDNILEKIVASKSDIKIYKNNLLVKQFYPYGEKYNLRINLAVGNVQDDAKLEIVTGTQNGAGPHIKIFNYNGEILNNGWLAYDKNFRGGVQVALGDLNGNGYKEIITGAGFGGGPHIRIFDYNGHLFDPGFFAYDKKFRGGVNVACADLNNDNKDEIITGAGRTGGPHIRIFDKIGHLIDPGFFAFDKISRQGVKAAAVDIDNDGQVEILGMQ